MRLRAALENLIDNAVKFTERGAVRLEARASPAGRGRTRLVCRGAPTAASASRRAEIKRLFRPFAQANAEIARHYGGSGLGLAVVKRLAKLMGGDLTVTSTPGRGSSFRFTAVLPIVSADAAAQPERARPRRRRRAALAILCAEDNPYGRVILNTILTELGHRADFVGSGEDAVGGRDARLRCRADGRDAARHRRPRSDAPHPRASRRRRPHADRRHFRRAATPATRRRRAPPAWIFICASR